jgi:hypothetical protein
MPGLIVQPVLVLGLFAQTRGLTTNARFQIDVGRLAAYLLKQIESLSERFEVCVALNRGAELRSVFNNFVLKKKTKNWM